MSEETNIEKLLDEMLSPTAHKVFRDAFRERIARFVNARIASLESRERKLREALEAIIRECTSGSWFQGQIKHIARAALADAQGEAKEG